MRLIDADKLIEDIHKRNYISKALSEIFETIIDEQPTAYDVDELLKQLEENFKPDIECFEYAEDYEYSLERYNRIIETVKRGGKEQ